MKRTPNLLALGASALISMNAAAQADVSLWRIDCGTGATPMPALNARFSDTLAFPDLKLTFTYSCYLIKHGDDYMVWDTGFTPGTNPSAPKTGIADYMAQVKVKAEQVKFVGISHFHADHTGQLAPFTSATLLIGKGDWDGVTANPPMGGANTAGFKVWIAEGRKVEPQTGDKDIFGDGSVVMMRAPGHTPGHSILLVQLKEKGAVLLTGDLVHFRENYEAGGVPSFNVDRAQTVASIERLKKLPAFPAAAR
jgi:N-acyl homoserine lactone hydrolase